MALGFVISTCQEVCTTKSVEQVKKLLHLQNRFKLHFKVRMIFISHDLPVTKDPSLFTLTFHTKAPTFFSKFSKELLTKVTLKFNVGIRKFAKMYKSASSHLLV